MLLGNPPARRGEIVFVNLPADPPRKGKRPSVVVDGLQESTSKYFLNPFWRNSRMIV